jgi:hypothetical protein
MSCDHCTHCQDRAKNQQETANLHPLGTHLIHPKHGHVVYWRNDIDRDGSRGRGHYVYRADDEDRELFYVYGDDFEVATFDVDLPGALATFLAADATAEQELNELATSRRAHRGGVRLTLAYAKLYDLSRLIYWVRDMADSAPARRAAGRVALKIRAATN